MSVNPFYFDSVDEYTRDYDVLGNSKLTIQKYIKQRLPQYSDEAISEFVDKKFKEDGFVKSPAMNVLRREPRGDRSKAQIGFLDYLKWQVENKHSMAPNMVGYCNPEIEKSYLSEFIQEKIKSRKVKKVLASSAKEAGDKNLYDFYFLGQNNDKIAINSLSGALSVKYGFLYLGSGHSGLTSNTRAVTSYANAINEKLNGGNRNYFNPDVVKEDLAFLSRKVDMAKLAVVVEKYNIRIPSVDDTFEHIMMSTRRHWNGPEELNIYKQISGMTAYERVAVMYVGDMDAMRKYDDSDTLRHLYTELLRDVPIILSFEEAELVVKAADADLIALIGLLCSNYLAGTSLKELHKNNPEHYIICANKIKHVIDTFVVWKDFVNVFWTMDFLPAQIHSIYSIPRHVVVGSDTDSDIFTSNKQVYWYCGNYGALDLHINVTAITIYISSQIIGHSLMILSSQMGVTTEALQLIQMKNEYLFGIMIVTTKTKHYMALKNSCEGKVYAKPELEVKGVSLRGSKIAKSIAVDSDTFFYDMMLYTTKNVGKMTPKQIMAVPAYIEHKIYPALAAGEVWPLNAARVNKEEGYAKPLSSDYFQYMLWNAIFGGKYGNVELLPSAFVKVPVTLNSTKKRDDWIETLPEGIKQRAKEFFFLYPNKKLNNIFVPVELLPQGRLPEELIPVINYRKHITQTMMRFYIIMECYGLFFLEKKMRKLVSDVMTIDEAIEHSFFDLHKLAVNKATSLNTDYLDDYYFDEDEEEEEEEEE